MTDTSTNILTADEIHRRHESRHGRDDDAALVTALTEASESHDAALEALHRAAGDRALSASEQRKWDAHTREKNTLDREVGRLDAQIIEERDARVAAHRAKWGTTKINAIGPDRRYPDNGEHRYGVWLAEYRDSLRANTLDSTTMSGKGRGPLVNQNLNSWFDLVRPQSKLLDGFNWQRIITERTQVDVPKIKADGPATATSEGADITGNSAFDVESILITPTKWSSYEAISTEVWRDAQPNLLDGFAMGIVKRHALAWEAALVAALEASATVVGTDANFGTNLDVISDTLVTMQAAGATPSGIVTTAAVAQELLKVKEVSGSTKPILSGPADGFAGYVLGVPLVVSSAVTATKACIFDANHTMLVVRQSPLIEVSADALFGTDSVAVRAVSRFAAKLMNATGAYLLADAA